MLSSQNCGKYLYGRWERMRQSAMRTRSDDKQAWLELTDGQIGGVNTKEAYEARTTPIDPYTPSKKRDIRTPPEKGN